MANVWLNERTRDEAADGDNDDNDAAGDLAFGLQERAIYDSDPLGDGDSTVYILPPKPR